MLGDRLHDERSFWGFLFISVRALNLYWALVYLQGDIFHNEPSFWGMYFCWGFEFTVGRWSTCWGTFFIMSLLSGVCIFVRALNLQLGVGVPVR